MHNLGGVSVKKMLHGAEGEERGSLPGPDIMATSFQPF